MSLTLKDSFSITSADGKTASFADTTGAYNATANTGGYGSPNPAYSSISGIRLLIGNYNALTNTTTVPYPSALVQYTEYIKTAGTPQVYDGKTISVGQNFIPQIAGLTVLSGDTFQTTGRYNPFIDPTIWLPTSTFTPLYLTAPQLGFTGATVIPDTVITISYEVYGNLHSSGFTSTSGLTYLVTGTHLVTYLGNTYRQGDVFIATDASSVASGGGGGTFGVSEFLASNYNSFITAFNVTGQIVTLQVSNILNPKPRPQMFDIAVAQLYTKLDAINRQAQTGLASYMQANDLLLYCVEQTNNLSNGIY